MASCLLYVSLALRLSFRLMNLFRIFKNQLEAGDVPTNSSTSHPVDSEILVQGTDPITAE